MLCMSGELCVIFTSNHSNYDILVSFIVNWIGRKGIRIRIHSLSFTVPFYESITFCFHHFREITIRIFRWQNKRNNESLSYTRVSFIDWGKNALCKTILPFTTNTEYCLHLIWYGPHAFRFSIPKRISLSFYLFGNWRCLPSSQLVVLLLQYIRIVIVHR